MTLQPSLCRTWSETPKTGFLRTRLISIILQTHHDKSPMLFIPPNTPLLCGKTGVYRGIHYFLIFALKHRLWVLTIYILSKNITVFHQKIVIFTAVENHSILLRRFYIMIGKSWRSPTLRKHAHAIYSNISWL